MCTLREITGERRIDLVRSQDIREQCEMQPIEERATKRREEWDSHIRNDT
jgi:hypothetical protein